MGLPTILSNAKLAQEHLKGIKLHVEASAVGNLIRSRISSQTLNGELHKDNQRLRDLLRRASDVVGRDEKDGAVWAQLLGEIRDEIGQPQPTTTATLEN